MMQTNYDTDPGLQWKPTARQPKHGASVVRTADGYEGSCPLGCAFTLRQNHSDAMIDTLNHRMERK